jgi:hypothetical protein
VRHYEPIDTVVEAVEVNGLDLDDIVVWINEQSFMPVAGCEGEGE